MSNVMLDARSIVKTYTDANRELTVLDRVNVQINHGEVLAIVGRSGAGKSTLMHILGGLDKPTSGTVHLNGQDIYVGKDTQQSQRRNHHIGFIFQFYHLLPELNALENVVLPTLVKDNLKNMKPAQTKGMKLLSDVGLVDRFDHKPNQLSGGEQQRVAIARALINEPDIILCDEPTGNLDFKSGQAILDLLLDLNEHHKRTLVIVTHDDSIAQRCHRVLRMQDGQLKG